MFSIPHSRTRALSHELGANVHLVSSARDGRYPYHVEPFLPLFQRDENFDFVLSDSPLITGHAEVALSNVLFLVGLVNRLIDGMAPRIGYLRDGGEEPGADRSGRTHSVPAPTG
ncbi:hypothetical protein [Streptomyces tsukubensis]|uniref:Uncharacterized protein n=1 Tax=Streptomyces tsukubensis TaxID=83656 RepID=A0A1V4AB60_9ACTN|nr:hypothetical protein [Streptomyces tsukubensis]OON80583.1 hypothetical protein B1H18_11885 [Streptomyces tsukubensis]QFR96235.1 hypothetical protein GBW32_28370 [Streptomyces tsukubensis]